MVGSSRLVFDVFVFCSTVSVSDFSKEVGYFFWCRFFYFLLNFDAVARVIRMCSCSRWEEDAIVSVFLKAVALAELVNW